jgi:hypothetical protein
MNPTLYCPHCADRLRLRALSLDFEEVVTCPACARESKAARLLTDAGKNLLDYFAEQSLRAAMTLPTAPDSTAISS